MMEREILLVRLEKSRTTCKQIEDAQTELTACLQTLETSKEECENILSKGMGLCWVLGIGIGYLIMRYMFWPGFEYLNTIMGDFFILPIIFLIALGIFGLFIIIIVAQLHTALFSKGNYNLHDTRYAQVIPPLEQACEISAQNLEILMASDDILTLKSFIPDKYLSSVVLDYLYEMIATLRADTLKEAINLYEDKLYKQEVAASMSTLQKQQALLIEMEKNAINLQQEQLDELEENTKALKKTRNAVLYGNVVSTVDTVRHWKKD